MLKVKKYLLFLSFLLIPLSLWAWGGGTKLSDGSCQFDKETGYTDSTFYTKDHEAFVIVDVTDSRYGTTSTIYNAVSCEKITSGEKFESNFSEIMEKKGFSKTGLKVKGTLDKDFQSKITFRNNSNNLQIHVEHIPAHVTQELKTLISSIANKGASSQINISSATKEFLGYNTFYTLLFSKLNSLAKTEINYNYALSLIDKLQKNNINVNSSQGRLLATQGELKAQIVRIEKETNTKFFDSSVKGVDDIPAWMDKIAKLGKQELISDYIPKMMSLADFGKNLNLNNFLSSTEYRYVLKDLKPKVSKRLSKSTYGMALDYGDKTIELTQSGSCEQGENSTSEFSCGFFSVNTCVGTYENYSCRGDTSKIAQIEKQVLGTQKIAAGLREGWQYDHMISRYTKATEHNTPSGQNMCLGKWDKSYCFSSNLSQSDQNMCLGRWDKSYCFSSNLSQSDQNMCLGKWDKSYCYSSNLSQSKQNMCLGKWDKSYCYSSNLSQGDQNMCLGWREKSYCYSSEI